MFSFFIALILLNLLRELQCLDKKDVYLLDTQTFQIKDFMPLINTLIGGFISWKVTKIAIFPQKNVYILKTQLYKVYLPLFKLISKNIFQDRSPIEIEPLLIIIESTIEQHYELIDPSLISSVKSCRTYFDKVKRGELVSYPNTNNEFSNEEQMLSYFKKAEVLISKNFDMIRSKLGLPTRSFFFKLSNNQLRPILSDAVDTLLTCLIVIFTFSAITGIVAFTLSTFVSAYIRVSMFINCLIN